MQPRTPDGRFAAAEGRHGLLLSALASRPDKHAGLVDAMYPRRAATDEQAQQPNLNGGNTQ
jgi:hypothetical protein